MKKGDTSHSKAIYSCHHAILQPQIPSFMLEADTIVVSQAIICSNTRAVFVLDMDSFVLEQVTPILG